MALNVNTIMDGRDQIERGQFFAYLDNHYKRNIRICHRPSIDPRYERLYQNRWYAIALSVVFLLLTTAAISGAAVHDISILAYEAIPLTIFLGLAIGSVIAHRKIKEHDAEKLVQGEVNQLLTKFNDMERAYQDLYGHARI